MNPPGNLPHQPVRRGALRADAVPDRRAESPRCIYCRRPTPRGPVCSGCAETIAEQQVTQ